MRRVDCSVNDVPCVIQGGMGFGVSDWRLAREVSLTGQLGVVSGVGLDLMVTRRLQDGDAAGNIRRALAAFPDQGVVKRILDRFFIDGGRAAGVEYLPLPHLSLTPSKASLELVVVGTFVEVWLAKEGHENPVGVNLMEKVQVTTVGALLGALLAGVDVVLVGAGVPREIPRVLDAFAEGVDVVRMPAEVEGAAADEFMVEVRPSDVLDSVEKVPEMKRPVFLAIVSAHVLAAYLAREDGIRPDGFVVELSPAGGHNAPPRRAVFDEDGEMMFGPRDEPDLEKVAAVGLPFWIGGAMGSPEGLADALACGARGVQVGTVFALSLDSGIRPDVKRKLLDGIRSGTLRVRTDALASPTGFPFKVAQIEGTLSEDAVYHSRVRLCDQGYLRTPYKKEDGRLGYKCAAEPEHMYVKKGGDVEDTVGRKCICNGLMATAGMGQVRKDGYVEAPIVTLGSNVESAQTLIRMYPQGWSARNVVEWLVGDGS